MVDTLNSFEDFVDVDVKDHPWYLDSRHERSLPTPDLLQTTTYTSQLVTRVLTTTTTAREKIPSLKGNVSMVVKVQPGKKIINKGDYPGCHHQGSKIMTNSIVFVNEVTQIYL